MDLKKFRKNLNRINNFDDWSDKPKVKLSRIEKDVLLKYITKLYDAVLFDEFDSTELENSNKNSQDQKNIISDHNSHNDNVQIVITEKVKPSEKPEEANTGKTEGNISGDLMRESLHSHDPGPGSVKTGTDNKSGTGDAIQIKNEKTIEQISVPEINIADNIRVSDEFMDIFTDKVTHELSEKLSMMPISDLRKAFGINEKIFTVNELFGSDMKYFDLVISELNEMTSFDEAKNYILKNLVSRFKWDDKSNHKKVETFIRTIRRRFLI